MTYGNFKDLTERTASGKVLRDKGFNIAKIWNMMGIKGIMFQRLKHFLIKKLLAEQLKMKICEKKS